MAKSTWEKERGRYVTSRAGRRDGARRRGEILAARGRRIDRERTGATEGISAEVITRRWIPRTLAAQNTGKDIMGMLAGLTLLMILIGVTAGIGLILGRLLYAVRYALIDKLGPMRRKSWIAALVLVCIGFGAWVALDQLKASWAAIAVYGFIQIVVALIEMIWLIGAWGWPAVTISKAFSDERYVVDIGAGDWSSPDTTKKEETTDEEAVVVEEKDNKEAIYSFDIGLDKE